MKKSIFFVLIICLVLSSIRLIAQTPIPEGQVSGTWQFAGSPYQILGDIEITEGQSLTIEPGCLVEFQGYYKLIILGNILAIGNQTDTITFTTTQSNQVAGWNGLVFLNNNNPLIDSSFIKYCKFEYGRAFSNNKDEEEMWGGAIYANRYDNLIISNSYFASNMADVLGGAIFCDSARISIIDNTFINNSAGRGGAIYGEFTQFFVANNVFRNNHATSYGAAFGAGASQATITNNIFSNNDVDYDGVIYLTGRHPDIQLDNIICSNQIFNNSAGRSGAITFMVWYSNNLTNIVRNNLIINNTVQGSESWGAGIVSAGENVVITGNTISNNQTSGDGGAIWLSGDINVEINNSILYNNSATSSGDQVYISDEDVNLDIYFSDIEGGTAAFGLGTSVVYDGIYENNIDADPYFGNPEEMNYLIPCNSPCFNTGNPDTLGLSIPLVDIGLRPRIISDTIDMGAYEFQNMEFISISNDTTLCQFSDLQLSLEAKGDILEFQWYKDDQILGGKESNILYLPNVQPDDEGYYYCKVFSNCDSLYSDSAYVTIMEAPLVNLGTDTTICISDSITLDAGEGFNSYLWSNGSTEQTILLNGYDLGVGMHTSSVDVSNENGCYHSDSIIVSVATTPQIELGQDTAMCENETIILHAGLGFTTYLWSDGSISPSLTVSEEGQYWAEVTIGSCSATDSIYITFYSLPEISLGNDTTITVKDTLDLDAGGGFVFYLWNDGTTNQYFSILGTLLEPGIYNYYVGVMNTNGCINSDTISVTIIDNSGLNSFTANNLISIHPNPTNGLFEIEFTNFKKGKIKIELFSLNNKLVYIENRILIDPIKTLQLDVRNINKGAYIMKIDVNEMMFTVKLLID